MDLSFIIPAHNEQELLGGTLAAVHEAAEAVGVAYEVIVADDDSTDRTVAVASEQGARVLLVNRRQIGAVRNAGAAAARGELLLFLDADTILPAATLAAAVRALRCDAVGGGAPVRFEGPLPLTGRLGVAAWNAVSRAVRWAPGCCLFARRADFVAVGGFNERFFAAEEILLSRALHRRGPFTILPHPVYTSSRKLTAAHMAHHWRILGRTLLTAGRALQSRDGLDLWYEPDLRR